MTKYIKNFKNKEKKSAYAIKIKMTTKFEQPHMKRKKKIQKSKTLKL